MMREVSDVCMSDVSARVKYECMSEVGQRGNREAMERQKARHDQINLSWLWVLTPNKSVVR
jgi:hypothetical protein